MPLHPDLNRYAIQLAKSTNFFEHDIAGFSDQMPRQHDPPAAAVN